MDAVLVPPHGGRIFEIDFNGERAWCKRAVPGHPQWRYRALDIFARALDFRLVRAVANPGGIPALETERQRLRDLRLAGVPVPRVLAASEDWHVLSHSGISLRQAIRQSPCSRHYLALQAIDAVHAVHANGQYLSQAFDRNLCVHDDRIHFIDFEDDPGTVFSVRDAQARDWLLLLSSLAHHFETDVVAFEHLCTSVFGKLDDHNASALQHDAKRLRGVLHAIPGWRRVRELRRLKLFADCATKHLRDT